MASAAFITVLLEKLSSTDLIELARSEGIHSDLEQWKKTLSTIQKVLADANQKQIKDIAVDQWLQDLQDVAYDMDDVVDDIATEAMRHLPNEESYATGTSTNKVLKIIPNLRTIFTPRTIKYGHKMRSKLGKITTKLRDLDEKKHVLGLDEHMYVQRLRMRRAEEISMVDEDRVLGREGDKKAIVQMLLGNEPRDQNVGIVSIVGMGGIGKTTLARVLYNDPEIEHHFPLKAWTCVSDEFDVFNISKSIFQSVSNKNMDFANLDLLQVALREILSKKRFLLVLDDVLNKDYTEWELLQRPFAVGAPGSRILVTSRDITVASVMDTLQLYRLHGLSNDKALSLFAFHAVGKENFDKYPTLESYGKQIVEKCQGLPLALKTLGRLMRTKTCDEDWKEVLNSEIWNLYSNSKILPALRLSYNDLPPYLKCLFAYCCLFPLGYEFDKHELVLLWMAEGFLNESVGRECFEELASRSFFLPSTNKQSKYMMQNLINDLARSVAGKFFFRLDDKMDVCTIKDEDFDKFLHISFIGKRYGAYRKFRELHRARRLRTFLPVSFSPHQCSHYLSDYDLVELLPQLPFLRVLSLSHHSITKIPQSIGSLKHLRYLNFSKTCIERLPEQVTDLCNLQTLLVSGCRELSSLPVSFVKLINLRHLDISDTPRLNKMPLGIGGLKNLQTLPKFIIESANGFKISELKGLSDLRGRLSISGLDKVMDRKEAMDADLRGKEGLVDLELRWSDVSVDSHIQTIQYKVLEGLKPHHELRKLKIVFYGGEKFPSWVWDTSFNRLKELTLRGCKSCTHLPTLGHRSLEVLKVDDMQDLKSWSSSEGDNFGTTESFSCLREISIKNCPSLIKVSIGSTPSLRFLHIEGCSKEVLRDMVSVSSSIVRLTIRNIKGLTQLDGEVLEHLWAVEDLCIKDCDGLRYLWESELEACKFLNILEKLEVSSCKRLVSLGEKDLNLESGFEFVNEVILNGCKALKRYKCPNSVKRLEILNCSSMLSLTFSMVHPSSLEIVRIGKCDKLRSFPEGCFVHLRCLEIEYCKHFESFTDEILQNLTSLEELEVHDCPSIGSSFPNGLWPPNLRILRIGCLQNPMSNWGLQNYPPSLVQLHLYGENSGVVSFAMAEEDDDDTISSSFLLPPSLTCLEINGFEELRSVSRGLQHLTRLEKLYIRSCPKLRDIPKTTATLKVTLY